MQNNINGKNGLFNAQIRDKILYISFVNDLTCEKWGLFWGDINVEFCNDKIMSCINKIVINLEECLYADAMALMSVMLDLIKVKEDYKMRIDVIIPRMMADDVNNRNYKRGQFLKFLAIHGFLQVMSFHFSLKDNKRIINRAIINHYMNYNYPLPFSGNVVVPIMIYECDNEDSKKKIIDEILDKFLFNFKGNVSLKTYTAMEGYVYNIITELVENSIRHAYKKDEKKRFALCIRNRKGNNSEGLNGFNPQEITAEKGACPAINTQIYMENSAFLEIIFCDIGIGLTESLREYYKEHYKNYKYPVRELFCKVLKDGIRKNNTMSITPFGGLHFICRIIRENNGYIWCNEGKEWVGSSSVRLLTDGQKGVISRLTDNPNKKQTQGLNWCFRIPYNDVAVKRRYNVASTWMDIHHKHPVFDSYQDNSVKMELSHLLCIDEIKQQTILMNGEYKNWDCLCIEQLKEIPLKSNLNTLVWIPKSNYTKNEILAHLSQYLEKLEKQAINNIVISDVDSIELLNYFYAIEKNTSKILKTDSVKTIFVITNKWEIICFQNINGVFMRNKDNEKEYFVNNSDYLYENIKAYTNFIKIYDSYCFWNLIKKHKNQKLFINAKVKWGNQDIHGYLNLESIYLFEDLYAIVNRSLTRLTGLVDDENIEYKNIDQTVERVCQDINYNISIQDDDVTIINVCGACASGYTRESYYFDNSSSLDVILFLHPVFDKEIKDVAILFIWPESGFFEDFPVDKEVYYRLGKTSFITTNREDMLIDTSSIYKNVTRNKNEMYQDFQMRSPKFIRYGHYKTDNHHYLIGFDFISYLKYSYLKKDGAFLYFLWKTIYYLHGEDLTSCYDEIKDNEWVEALKKCKYKKDSNHGELVIYHSNTYTEYIMKLIKNILPESLAHRILPVNIFTLQDKGSPLTLSPFFIKKLQNVFVTKQNRGILYIDSSFSTGRRMFEIENIFLAQGCKKVSFLTILDMRRLRNGDFKNSSYWKINLPRLDDDGHCILCSALKKIEQYKKKSDSEIIERLQMWERNWNCMNINNSISEHGIESIENLSCNFGDIDIRDSVSLNMYIAEKLCESYSNDFVYTYITEKTDLDRFLRMQLICTQIILFGDQHSRKLQLSLLSELIGLMSRTEEVNTYTSLAGLIIISQKPEVIYELLNEVLYLNKAKKIQQIRSSLLSSSNLDLVISIGFFLKNNYMIEQLLNGFHGNTESVFIDMVNEHTLPDKDLKLLFKEFEGLYVNEMGRRHNTNRQKLLSEHSTEYKDFEKRCNQVTNDMNRLYELIKHFPIALANSCGTVVMTRYKINEVIAKLSIEIRNRQKEYQNRLRENEEIQQFSAGDGIRLSVKECEKIFDEVMDSYYISYGEKANKYFSEIVAKYEEKYGKSINLNISVQYVDNNTNKYYYWNASIEKEFIYMLENVEHCTIPLTDVASDKKNTMMNVDIDFQFNKILIKFTSWSDKMSAQVKDAFLSKNRLTKEQAIAFDVIFDFNDSKKDSEEGQFLLESKISIPACYPELKGD